MYRAKIRSVAFTEYPVKDLGSTKVAQHDVLLDLKSALEGQQQLKIEEYCLALLEKLCSLCHSEIKSFLSYQAQLLSDPVRWLMNLDELILTNADLFENRNQQLKADRTLLFSALLVQEYSLVRQYEKRYDLEAVKQKLLTMKDLADQLTFLYTVKTEYLQNPQQPKDPNELSFDRKIDLEIQKIDQLQDALNKLKAKQLRRSTALDNIIDNDEFIRIMKISKRTAQNWRNTGVIAFSQIHHKIYYQLSDVEKLLKSNYLIAVKRNKD